jgi:hypothetical protein
MQPGLFIGGLEWVMAASPHRRGTGNDEGRKKGRQSDAGDAEDVQPEESAAAGPEEEAAEPEDAPRPPRLYGYDPDQWPESS